MDEDILNLLSRYRSIVGLDRIHDALRDDSTDEQSRQLVRELVARAESLQSRTYTLPLHSERLSADLQDALSVAEALQHMSNDSKMPENVRQVASSGLEAMTSKARADIERMPSTQQNQIDSRKNGLRGIEAYETRERAKAWSASIREARTCLHAIASMASSSSIDEEVGLLLRANSSLSYEERARAAMDIGAQYACKGMAFKHISFLGLKMKANAVPKFMQDIATLPAYFSYGRIETAHRVSIPVPIVGTKDRRETRELWGLDRIQAYQAQRAGVKGKGVSVGIIDTGVEYTHDDLKKRFGECKGVNIRDGTDDPCNKAPYEQHGTHVAGTIAGETVGVAPLISLYSIRVLGTDGGGSEIDVIAGIDWALSNDLHVINMSLGSPFHTTALADMCRRAYEQGMILVAAAGNSGDQRDNFPAHLDGVIAVAATDYEDERASFSTINSKNDVCAPGVNIYSSIPGNTYTTMSGTSMASPHVTGAVALGLERLKENIESRLIDSALNLGPVQEYGHGLVQAATMLNLGLKERILQYLR
ncbi:MAG: S8 family peptidase [Candidatus Woesearchaeota archaeon]